MDYQYGFDSGASRVRWKCMLRSVQGIRGTDDEDRRFRLGAMAHPLQRSVSGQYALYYNVEKLGSLLTGRSG